MKKRISLSFTSSLFIIFIIWTIIIAFMAYGNIEIPFSSIFVQSYIVFIMLFLFYICLSTILKLRKLTWFDIRKRLIKFIITFIVFGSFNYILDYFFRPTEIDLFRAFSISLGLSLSMSFYDVIFFKNKKTEIV